MERSITDFSRLLASYFGEELFASLERSKDISLLMEEMERFVRKAAAGAMSMLLEEADAIVRAAPERRREWEIHESSSATNFGTIFGEVYYSRTYYRSKEKPRDYVFLSDRILGIGAHDKTDALLDARMIEEAVDLAYRKRGKKASRAIEFTGQTVMNKIRKLGPVEYPIVSLEKKKEVEVLYINADEDHVASQVRGGEEPRLVYVYEGMQLATKELPEDGRPRMELLGKRSFSGVYENYEDLWLKVADYIEKTYDTEKIRRIYLSGDGAPWIRGGANWIDKSVYVVDKYHLSKYVMLAGAHVQDGVNRIWAAIHSEDEDYFDIVMDTLVSATESRSKIKEINNAKRYIKGVWDTLKYHKEADYIGCSAEGHVSHILSARLSSRPMGWSKEGVDCMARLRVFRENGGNIYQQILKKKEHLQFEIKITKKAELIRKMEQRAAGLELTHNLSVINYGKVTGLNSALKMIRGIV